MNLIPHLVPLALAVLLVALLGPKVVRGQFYNPKEEISYETYGDYLDQNSNSELVAEKPGNSLLGAFNLNNFKIWKLAKPLNIKVYSRILKRYDITAVSEIYDKSEIATRAILAAVNFGNLNPQAYNVSEPHPKTKERFGIFYKKLKFELVQSMKYDDPEKLFKRPPVAVSLKFKNQAEAPPIIIINVHLNRRNTTSEIGNLIKVVEWAQGALGGKDVIITGDFNAGCGNVPKEDWANLTMYTDKEYQWLIPKDMPTTHGKLICAHDKIVITGPWLRKNAIATSGNVFKFDRAYNLDRDEAMQVSKHYPVEFVLKQ